MMANVWTTKDKWTSIHGQLKEVNESVYTSQKKETPEEFVARQKKIKHDKYLFITNKYYLDIITKISLAKGAGKKTQFMNFVRDDFKAGSKGLGFPKEFQRSWINDVLLNGNNVYTEQYFKNDKCLCEVLIGVKAEIFYNALFTTVFSL